MSRKNKGMSEKTLFESRTHMKVLVPPVFVQLLLIVAHVALLQFWPDDFGPSWLELAMHAAVVFLELWYVVVPVLRWRTSVFVVTDRKVFKKWGVLYKHSREIPLKQITSVNIEKGIIDRIFGAGTLVLHDASSAVAETHGSWNKGNDRPGVRFQDIPSVGTVKEIVDHAVYNAD